MCFNAEVSLGTYIAGSAGSLLLASHNLPLGLLYLTVVQMQLVEYLLWRNPSCDAAVNRAATRAGIVVNHVEPLVFYLALLGTGVVIPLEAHLVVLLYTFVASGYTKEALETVQCTTLDGKRGCSPHLYWKWNDLRGKQVVYGLFLATLITLSLSAGDVEHAWISVATFGVSALLYSKTSAVGSMWCFIAAFLPWFLLHRYTL
ncbi:MAG: hypothetical protein ACO35C_03825 [Pontimonas sp.]